MPVVVLHALVDVPASSYRAVFRPEAQAELHRIPRDMALRVLARPTELKGDNGELVVRVVRVAHRSTVYGT